MEHTKPQHVAGILGPRRALIPPAGQPTPAQIAAALPNVTVIGKVRKNLPLLLWETPFGMTACCPVVPGATASGQDRDAVLKQVGQAIRVHLATHGGDAVPDIRDVKMIGLPMEGSAAPSPQAAAVRDEAEAMRRQLIGEANVLASAPGTDPNLAGMIKGLVFLAMRAPPVL